MKLEALRQEVLDANLRIVREGLVRLTWGNVSGIDRETGCFVIKPSGVDYADLTTESLVIVDLEGMVVEGKLRPSSDTETHRILYREFSEIGGITHTHSPMATAFAQAGVELPCLGTTHADHFYGTVPLVRELTPEEVADRYEEVTGIIIATHFRERGIDPMEMPACFQKGHAPFTWGHSAAESVNNSIALEMCAEMALATWQIRSDVAELSAHLLEKHYSRKHGLKAYYGQL